MQDCKVDELPLSTLQDFLDFDTRIGTEKELEKKLVHIYIYKLCLFENVNVSFS